MHRIVSDLFLSLLLTSALAVEVNTDAELTEALANVQPGTVITMMPGEYTGGRFLEDLHGTTEAPIILEGSGEVVFQGGAEALHLVDCRYVTLRGFSVSGYPTNGINADDGGSFETPAHHLVFENLRIENTGPTGNHDALKLSGVDDFIVRGCTFSGWGGSAVDMVGCHEGRIGNCRFLDQEGHSQSSGVQIKGGSRGITVVQSFFVDAGARAINLGGSTGLAYFRPKDAVYEASDITIAGNRFVGSTAPIAWVTADGGHVHHNTIYLPENWVGRILQETTDARFIQSRNGVFEKNLVVFDSNISTFINVGPNTQPATFAFRGNAWFDAEEGMRQPSLPVEETNGVYNVDPRLIDPGTESMRIGSSDPRLVGIGAEYYEPDDIRGGAWAVK